jgi:hypothetical protein
MASSKTNLSTRGDVFATPTSKIPLLDVVCDLWHPETNPGGYVSLGVAENVCYFRDNVTGTRLLTVADFDARGSHRAHDQERTSSTESP